MANIANALHIHTQHEGCRRNVPEPPEGVCESAGESIVIGAVGMAVSVGLAPEPLVTGSAHSHRGPYRPAEAAAAELSGTWSLHLDMGMATVRW